MTGALIGSLKIPVVTSFPCHLTSLGNPTFTDKIFIILQLPQIYAGVLVTLDNDAFRVLGEFVANSYGFLRSRATTNGCNSAVISPATTAGSFSMNFRAAASSAAMKIAMPNVLSLGSC